jgi:hypothetical protein
VLGNADDVTWRHWVSSGVIRRSARAGKGPSRTGRARHEQAWREHAEGQRNTTGTSLSFTLFSSDVAWLRDEIGREQVWEWMYEYAREEILAIAPTFAYPLVKPLLYVYL